MFENMDPEKVIVCRCEGITLKEVLEGIEKFGLRDVEAIKRVYRCGMGACQGRTCGRLLEQILRSKVKGEEIEGTGKFKHRPPLIPVSFKEIAEVCDR